MKDNNKFRFDIPGWIIFLAYVFYWPVGIVLTVLRSISIPTGRSSGQSESKTTAQKEDTVKRKKKHTSRGFKLMTAGAVASFIGAILMAINSLSFADVIRVFAVSSLPLFVLAGLFLLGANYFKKRDERFDRIRTVLGGRSSMNLVKLSAACGTSLKQTRKDVQKLIDMGIFGEEAYIDLGANNFMRNSFVEPDEPQAFDYRTVYGNLFKDEEKDGTSKSTDNGRESENEKDEFSKIIREIRRLNDDIKDVPVSYRIQQIEEHTKNIFDYVTDHPEAMPQIRSFMNYYLPTTLKLLESYYRIERVGVAGENMKKSKENIENTLDLLVVGFEQQVDQLFRNESIDISADITVLETMMKKDGLHQDSAKDLANLAKQYSSEISNSVSDEQNGGVAAMEKPLS